MAEQFFPGFEGDDEPKQTAKPAPAPAAPAGKKPAFDAFADVPVQAPVPGAAEPPPPPAAAPGRAAGAPPRPAPPAPPPPPLPGADDADIKPGARKDLWACPHCGAGNKPDRDSCRVCGKSPTEAVIIPLWKRPLVRAAAIAVIGLVVVLWVMATRVDLSLREPVLANVDRHPRIGGSASGSTDLAAGVRFDGSGGSIISVVGRVAGVGHGPGGTITIALALGAAAQDEHPTATATANGNFDFPDGVVLACVSDAPIAVKPGEIISLKGVKGDLIKDAALMREAEGMIPVQVEALKIGD